MFFRGNSDNFLIGSLLSFIVELNNLPTRMLCIEYEEFKEYLKNPVCKNNTYQDTTNNNQQQDTNTNHQDTDNNEYQDIEQLQNELLELNKMYTELKNNVEEKEDILQKNMDKLQDDYCEFRDIENKHKREKEKEEERERIFTMDKKTYVNIKNKINNSETKFNENSIPELFVAKYNILKFMEINTLLEINPQLETNSQLDENKNDTDNIEYMIYNLLSNIIDEINFNIADVRNNSKDKVDNLTVINVLKDTILEQKDDYIDLLLDCDIDKDIKSTFVQIIINFMDYISKEYTNNVIITEKDIMNELNKDENNNIFLETITSDE